MRSAAIRARHQQSLQEFLLREKTGRLRGEENYDIQLRKAKCRRQAPRRHHPPLRQTRLRRLRGRPGRGAICRD